MGYMLHVGREEQHRDWKELGGLRLSSPLALTIDAQSWRVIIEKLRCR